MSDWAKVLGVTLAIVIVLDGAVARFGGMRKLIDATAKALTYLRGRDAR